MWHFVSVAKLITTQQIAHKIGYYGRSQFYVEFREGHKSKPIPVIYLFEQEHHISYYDKNHYDVKLFTGS